VKEEGAYLLVCRGGDLYASGWCSSARWRRGAGRRAGGPSAGDREERAQRQLHLEVQAKVIGSRNEDFVSGANRSPRRVRRPRSSWHEHGDRRDRRRALAFFRGQTELGPPPEPAKPAAAETSPPADNSPKQAGAVNQSPDNGLLHNLDIGNSKIQSKTATCSRTSISRTKGA